MEPNEKDKRLSGLHFSGDLFHLMFEEAPCYLSVLDTDLNLLMVNRRCREDFATPYTRHCYQVFKGRAEVCPDCPALITLAENRVSESDETLTDRSGREVQVVCRTAPICDEGSSVTGVLHMSVASGEKLRLQQDMKALDSQLGAASHGIKGLLTAMGGGFYLWESGLQKNRTDRLEQGFTIVRRNFQRLERMAHNVLYYVRDRRMVLEPLDGVKALESVAGDLQEDAASAGARIRLDEPLPEIAPLEADRRALSSMLVNLAVSSLDDCRVDKREIEHEVVLGVSCKAKSVVFEISDNGIGMEEEIVGKMFSLFFDPKGIEAAGVGLYITNKLARIHRGSVEISSEPGRGTTYRLVLPLGKSQDT